MREENWQLNLSNYLREIREQPFDFSTHNCLFYAFGGIKAVNGLDLLPLYAGRATNEIAGARALREVDGVDTVEAVLQKHLDVEFTSIAFARIGDIVFIEKEFEGIEAQGLTLFGPIPGICYGMTSLFVGKEGLVDVPTMQLSKALWVL